MNTPALKPEAVSHLLWWMNERHSIHLKRLAGEPKPWTDHPVMQDYFFTNPFRENDKTTKWFRETIRDPLKESKEVLMATFIFRRFNFIPTGKLLWEAGLMQEWDSRKAVALLKDEDKVFTGAYMISSPNGRDKLYEVCRMIDHIWIRRHELITRIEDCATLELAWHSLRFEHHKGLMPYEVVTDLRHTYLLRDATDIMTWAYFGPGGQRGCCRLIGRKVVGAAPTSMAQDECLLIAREALQHVLKYWPEAEMRDVEHSSCEMDKLMRACEEGGSRLKRRFDGR